MKKKEFIPAAHWHFLTPVYDFFVGVFGDTTLQKIVDYVEPKNGQRILDIGCGPGNLIVEIKKRAPKSHVTGLDVDPEILGIAKGKFQIYNIDADIVEESASEMPFVNNRFDVVTSTLMIHHLDHKERKQMMQEVYRVLKPRGKFFLYDFHSPKNIFVKLLIKFFGLFEDTTDAAKGNYIKFMEEAGFKKIKSLFHTALFELLQGEKASIKK